MSIPFGVDLGNNNTVIACAKTEELILLSMKFQIDQLLH